MIAADLRKMKMLVERASAAGVYLEEEREKGHRKAALSIAKLEGTFCNMFFWLRENLELVPRFVLQPFVSRKPAVTDALAGSGFGSGRVRI